MVIAADVEFSGPSRVSIDPGGVLRRQYLVIAESKPVRTTLGSAVATVVPLAGLPSPLASDCCQYAVFDGGERAAFDLAISGLKELPDNAGLAMHVHEV